MLFVPQVDAEGYLLTAPFVNAVDKLYTEDSLKALAKELAPDCVTEANAGAKREYKAQKMYVQAAAKNLHPPIFRIATSYCLSLVCYNVSYIYI
jgi:hypothetical protein